MFRVLGGLQPAAPAGKWQRPRLTGRASQAWSSRFLASTNGGAERPRRLGISLFRRSLLGGRCRLAGDRIACAFGLSGDEITSAFRLSGNEIAAAFRLSGHKIAGALRPGILRSPLRLGERGGARRKTGGYDSQLKRFHRSSPFSPNGNSTDGTPL